MAGLFKNDLPDLEKESKPRDGQSGEVTPPAKRRKTQEELQSIRTDAATKKAKQEELKAKALQEKSAKAAAAKAAAEAAEKAKANKFMALPVLQRAKLVLGTANASI